MIDDESTNNRGAGLAVNPMNIQESSEFNRDSQFSKYTN
jgi:hypothetical protein